MASVKPVVGKNGKIISWRVRVCVGRDEDTYKQIWRTTTIKHPEGLTPKRAEAAVEDAAKAWEKEQKAIYEKEIDEAGSQRRKKTDAQKQATPLSSFIRDKWLPNYVHDGAHRATTISFYQYMAEDICAFFGEKQEVGSIEREDIERYSKFLRTEAKTKRGDPLSATSVKRHLETFRTILTYAKLNKYIKENPFESYQIKELKKKKKVDYLHEEDAPKFFECLMRKQTKTVMEDGQEVEVSEYCVRSLWRLYIWISIINGLRRGEMLGLKWEDVDLKRELFYVRNNVTVDTSSSEGYCVVPPKNGEERISPFGAEIRDMLLEYRAEQEEKYGPIKGKYFLFCRDNDPEKPLYPTTPTTWIRRFEIANGLQHISPHDFRHTAGTYLRNLGHNDRDIQDHLGHSDSKISHEYYVADNLELRRKSTIDLEKHLMELIEAPTAEEDPQ